MLFARFLGRHLIKIINKVVTFIALSKTLQNSFFASTLNLNNNCAVYCFAFLFYSDKICLIPFSLLKHVCLNKCSLKKNPSTMDIGLQLRQRARLHVCFLTYVNVLSKMCWCIYLKKKDASELDTHYYSSRCYCIPVFRFKYITSRFIRWLSVLNENESCVRKSYQFLALDQSSTNTFQSTEWIQLETEMNSYSF